jgi:antitoxin (DNA-binding transcriptional repressor) of toxin-antitoxin stability system
LVRRAEAGEEIGLTRHGQLQSALVPVKPMPDPKARGRAARSHSVVGRRPRDPGAELSVQLDFLYREHGLPE